jgi:valyl-tRNA synthetase
MITRLARLSEITQAETLPKGAVTIAVEGGTFGLPIADLIDIGEERTRLEKTLGKVQKELGGLRGRLSNPKFIDSAPDDVITDTKAALSLKEEEEAKLNTALTRLRELE